MKKALLATSFLAAALLSQLSLANTMTTKKSPQHDKIAMRAMCWQYINGGRKLEYITSGDYISIQFLSPPHAKCESKSGNYTVGEEGKFSVPAICLGATMNVNGEDPANYRQVVPHNIIILPECY